MRVLYVDNADMYNKTTVSRNLARLMRDDPVVNAERKESGNENELARVTGVKQPTIHRILTGESREPRRSTLEKLAVYFGITADDFYSEDGVPDLKLYAPPLLEHKKPSDPLLDQMVKAYKSASDEARKMATLLLMADAELGGFDPTPGRKLPNLHSRPSKTKKLNRADT